MATVKLGLHSGSGRIYSGPTLVALDRDYFGDQGLEIEIVDAGGRRDVFPLFATGELDVCPQGMSLEYVQAFDQERPIIMAADHGSAGGGAGGIVARPELIDSGRLRDYADLKGLRIGVSPIRGDHDWRSFGAALKKGGLSFDDVEVVICDFGGGRHQALADGRLDLTTVGRPSSIVEGRETGSFVVWKQNSDLEDRARQGRTVMMNYSFWSQRPDDARRYLAAHLQGVRDYHNAYVHGVGRDAMVDLIARQCNEPRATVEATAPTPLNPDGYVDAKSIEEDLDWYAEQGVLPKPVPVDRVVNHTFLEQALAEVGRYQPPAGVR